MAQCTSLLSWDGILCERCRQFFNAHVVDRALAMRKNNKEREYDWWHDISTLKRCASQRCRFCALVLANFDGDEGTRKWLDELASWDIRLTIRIMDPATDGCHVYIYAPTTDPRPLSAEPPNYGFLVIDVCFTPIGDDKEITTYELSSRCTRSEETFEKIRAWLKHCTETHQACLGWPSATGCSATLPTRLLELGVTSQKPAIRLVLGQHLSAKSCRYATLSHCWGGGVPIKLLQQNLESFRSNIPWDSLPLTFRDAVLAVQNLGITYLWIDALCIIQDSEDDWASEVAMMPDVYANCYLNISANASVNGNGGLFRNRDPSVDQSFVIPCPKPDIKNSAYCCYIDRWHLKVEQAPLKERSWVVQERFLSPRVVHFCVDQVHWECTQLLTSEGLPDLFGIIPNTARTWEKSALCYDTLSHSRTRIEALYRLWSRLIESYSMGKLTFPSDRPVAIAGLARTFCHSLGLKSCDYMCGLWRPRFIQDLMWYTYNSQRRFDSGMPSWSWLSVDQDTVNFCYRTYKQLDDWQPIAELIDCNVSPRSDPFGAVSYSYATIRGPLCKSVISKSSEDFQYCKHDRKCNKFIEVGQDLLREGESFFLRLDENSDEGLEDVLNHPVYLLLCGGPTPSTEYIDQDLAQGLNDYSSENTKKEQREMFYSAGHYECLILMSAENSEYFRRVGYVKFAGHTSVGWKCKEKDSETPDCHELLDGQFRSNTIPDIEVDDKFMYTIIVI